MPSHPHSQNSSSNNDHSVIRSAHLGQWMIHPPKVAVLELRVVARSEANFWVVDDIGNFFKGCILIVIQRNEARINSVGAETTADVHV